MTDPGQRPTRWQLFLECAQRELTYLPLAGSFLLAYLWPEWGPTWLIAPSLFTLGGAHFIYDFAMGQDVRAALAARLEKKEAAARDEAIGELSEALPETDQKAILAVRALEKALMDKIKDNQVALEATGTFSHSYMDMVRSVADSAIAALRRKHALLETAKQLSELKADDDANQICEQIPALDDRIDQARNTLQEALTQLTLMETEQDATQISNMGGALTNRLKAAEQIAREVSEATRAALPQPEPVFIPAERPEQGRSRKKSRQGD